MGQGDDRRNGGIRSNNIYGPEKKGKANTDLKFPHPSSKKKSSFTVVEPVTDPLDRSRVRLFINEVGDSIARVIKSEYSVEQGYDPKEADRINKTIGELRDLGREFMRLESDPTAQHGIAEELRSKVAEVFSPDNSVSHMSRDAQLAIVKSYQLFLYLIEEAQDAERDLRCRARSGSRSVAFDPLLEKGLELSKNYGALRSAVQGIHLISTEISPPVSPLESVSISSVYTKHPTTIKYREMNKALRAVFRHFARDDWKRYYAEKDEKSFNKNLEPESISTFRAELDELIATVWRLPVVRPEKPTCKSEIEEGFLEIRYDILPPQVAVRKEIKDRGFDLNSNPIWRNKQWFGFDVDGNPFVGRDGASGALFLNNVRYLETLLAEMNDEVPQSIRMRLAHTIKKRAQEFSALLKSSGAYTSFLFKEELERALLIPAVGEPYASFQELINELSEIHSTTARNLVETIETSGFCLASGMFRENSNVLDLILETSIPQYKRMGPDDHSEEQLATNCRAVEQYFSDGHTIASIKEDLYRKKKAIKDGDVSQIDKALQTIEMLEFIAESQKVLGVGAVPEFILSLTENKGQILGYHKLIEACGVDRTSRVIPLFEEYQSLTEIDSTLRQLFSDPQTLESMKGEDGKVTVFLGMSDGQKTTGPGFPYLAADAEERVLAVAREFNVEVVIFLGIGSSQARGQDRYPEREYASRPAIRYWPVVERTIQGESIQRISPGGVLSTQILSKTLGSVLYHHAAREDEAVSLQFEHNSGVDEWKRRTVLNMCATARDEFSKFTLSQPYSLFISRLAPPLGGLNTASRPDRRSAKTGGDRYQINVPDTRAVPWNYFTIQNQTLEPTYFGADIAIAQMRARKHTIDDTKHDPADLLYRESSYFRDARFVRLIDLMIEGVAISCIPATRAMLDTRLSILHDPATAKLLNEEVLQKIEDSQRNLIEQLEAFVPSLHERREGMSIRERAFALMNDPRLAFDITRRHTYISVLSFIQAQGMNYFDEYLERAPEVSEYGLHLAQIAACGKANGHGQVG